MPKWEVHDKWAEKMGLSREIANFVNHLSDFPDKTREFRAFCEREGEEIILQLLRTLDYHDKIVWMLKR